jgi:hypothetical protein
MYSPTLMNCHGEREILGVARESKKIQGPVHTGGHGGPPLRDRELFSEGGSPSAPTADEEPLTLPSPARGEGPEKKRAGINPAPT